MVAKIYTTTSSTRIGHIDMGISSIESTLMEISDVFPTALGHIELSLNHQTVAFRSKH
jgi:hypothetical protein